MSADTQRWHARYALLPGGLARDVTFEARDGRFTDVRPGSPSDAGAVGLPGVVLPGMANCHSHAFHRALRGRTHTRGGTFWTWRDAMYAVAARLDPDSYLNLARATYAEMALAGVSAVGEFHYLHHAPGGVPYAAPNDMGEALIVAAAEAGISATLLDTCYLRGGPGAALDPAQERFSDGTADAWAARASELRDGPGVRVGAAVHSVRAVDPAGIEAVAAWAASRGAPLPAHVSEQPAENQ